MNMIVEKGIIEHSDSPYSSPITPVKERGLCCDFRKLNAKTIPKSFQYQERKIFLMTWMKRMFLQF